MHNRFKNVFLTTAATAFPGSSFWHVSCIIVEKPDFIMPKRELNLTELFSIVISKEQDEAIEEIAAIIEENLNNEEIDSVVDIAESRESAVSPRADAVKTILNLIANQSTDR